MVDVLRVRTWRRTDPTLKLLYSTRLVSQTGQAVFFAWLFVQSGSGTEGATRIGGAVIAMMVASILLGIPGGAAADGLGSRWALTTASALRLVAVIAGFWLLPDTHAALWALAFAYSAASQIFTPAELALVRVAGQRGLIGGHTMLVVLQYAGFGFGGLVLVPLLTATGSSSAAPVAATLLLAATVGITAALGHRLASDPSTAPPPLGRHPFIEVLSFFRSDRHSLYATGALAFSDMATRSLLLALPLYLLAELELTAPGIVGLMTVAAAGGLGGFIWVRQERDRASSDRLIRMLRMAMVAAIASSVALAILAEALSLTFSYSQLPSLPDVLAMPRLNVLVAMPFFALLGAVFTATPIAGRALLSARAPAFSQGRVFATQGTLSNLLVLLPLAIATAGTELIGARGTLIFVAITGGVVLFALERILRGERDAAPPQAGA